MPATTTMAKPASAFTVSAASGVPRANPGADSTVSDLRVQVRDGFEPARERLQRGEGGRHEHDWHHDHHSAQLGRFWIAYSSTDEQNSQVNAQLKATSTLIIASA